MCKLPHNFDRQVSGRYRYVELISRLGISRGIASSVWVSSGGAPDNRFLRFERHYYKFDWSKTKK